VFGIVTRDEAALIKPVSRSLLLKDALRNNEHGGLMFGPEAKAYLKGEHELRLILPAKQERTKRRGGSGGANPIGNPLFEALRAARRDLAMEAGVPPYVIFHDATLREIALSCPSSLSEMAKISGIGARKLEAYGEAFLDVVRQY
jgi:ATP-dependent DNA helicase RecQ